MHIRISYIILSLKFVEILGFSKIYNVVFKPDPPVIGKELRFEPKYSIQTGHYIKNISISLVNPALIIVLYEKTSYSGEEIFQVREEWVQHFKRDDKEIPYQMRIPTFLKTFVNLTFIYFITTRNINDTSDYYSARYDFQFYLEIPPATEPPIGSQTMINRVIFEPHPPKLYLSLCFYPEFIVKTNHYVKFLNITAANPSVILISFFKKQFKDEINVYYYYDYLKTIFIPDFSVDYKMCINNYPKELVNKYFRYYLISRTTNEDPKSDTAVQLKFKFLEPKTETILYGVTFAPSIPKENEVLCFLPVYLLRQSHYVKEFTFAYGNTNKTIFIFKRSTSDSPVKSELVEKSLKNNLFLLDVKFYKLCYKHFTSVIARQSYWFFLESAIDSRRDREFASLKFEFPKPSNGGGSDGTVEPMTGSEISEVSDASGMPHSPGPPGTGPDQTIVTEETGEGDTATKISGINFIKIIWIFLWMQWTK